METVEARCIYRVPVRIRSRKEDECTPKVVSIGPFHHGKESLKVMEAPKMIYLQDYLQRTNSSVKSCFNLVKKHEERLRGCYDERTEDYLSSDKFVNIILVDAVFIIEVLLRYVYQGRFAAPLPSDRIFGRPWMIQEVMPDLMLLENQVPFFILRALFDPHKSKLLPDDHQTDSLITLVYKFFQDRVLSAVRPDKLEKLHGMKVEHFVRFMICLHTPLDHVAPQDGEGSSLGNINSTTPTLTELHQAGVKFKVGSNIDVLDVQFTNGILKLPRFKVDRDWTVTMIRNMLAFEQCHFLKRYLSEYIMFMNSLVTTSKDVDLLIECGIVVSTPPDSSQAISLISSLSNGIILMLPNDRPFAAICSSLRSRVARQLIMEIMDVPSARCIYRVPFRIRSGKEDECTPTAVSIGPLHHGKESLKVMEGHKMIYVRDFLQRTHLSREWCFNVVKEHEGRLRCCYDERTDRWSSDEFVNIILVDAVFIIEVLLLSAFQGKYPAPPSDRIFGRPWMLDEVVPDFLLLENQVPFFILRALFDPVKTLLLPEDHHTDSLLTLAHKLFNNRVYLVVNPDKLEKVLSSNVEHLVHFMLCLHIPLDAPQGRPESEYLDPPSLTELHRAGIKFSVGSNLDVMDAHFTATSGDLKLPAFIVDRRTVRMIRNMLAFEQCHLQRRCLSQYLQFINCLVTTSKDVDLLIDHGIVALTPPDRGEVVSLLSGLSNGILILPDDFHFAIICASLRWYVKKPWNRWKANLKQNYFNTPWAVVSVIAAAFAIILTLLQTVFSILSAYN